MVLISWLHYWLGDDVSCFASQWQFSQHIQDKHTGLQLPLSYYERLICPSNYGLEASRLLYFAAVCQGQQGGAQKHVRVWCFTQLDRELMIPLELIKLDQTAKFGSVLICHGTPLVKQVARMLTHSHVFAKHHFLQFLAPKLREL